MSLQKLQLDIMLATDELHLLRNEFESVEEYNEQRKIALNILLNDDQIRLNVIELMVDDCLTLEKALLELL